MFERVTIIGAGAAGLAAAWAAAQRGAQIRLLDGGVGSSSLTGGAVDDRPWEQIARSSAVLQTAAVAGSLPHSVRVFSDDLGQWRLPREGEPLSRLATEAGRVRVARGHDLSVLDLSLLPSGARVVLPRVVRDEWHADSLARGLTEDAYSQSRALCFEAADAKLLKLTGEHRIAAADLAERHDDEQRRGWLATRLREVMAQAGRVDALLLGPWLGVESAVAGWLSDELGVAVGEIVGSVGSTAGLRFEVARARLLQTVGLELDTVAAAAITFDGDEVKVVTASGEQIVSDCAVLAIGGVAAGGIVYDPPEQRAGQDMPPEGLPPFRLSVDADVKLQADGKLLDVVSSIHGPSLDEVAWPTDADPGFLESVGVHCDGVQASERIFAAGDVMADKPRTLLQAVFSGIRAGAAAAGEPGAIPASR